MKRNNNSMEVILGIIAAFFVLFTAMIDPKVSLLVAGVAIICFFVYEKLLKKKEKAL